MMNSLLGLDRKKPDMEKDGHKFWKIYKLGDFVVCRHEYPTGDIDYLASIKGANAWIANFPQAEGAVMWVEVNYRMGFRKWNKKRHCLMKTKSEK